MFVYTFNYNILVYDDIESIFWKMSNINFVPLYMTYCKYLLGQSTILYAWYIRLSNFRFTQNYLSIIALQWLYVWKSLNSIVVLFRIAIAYLIVRFALFRIDHTDERRVAYSWRRVTACKPENIVLYEYLYNYNNRNLCFDSMPNNIRPNVIFNIIIKYWQFSFKYEIIKLFWIYS